MIRKVQIMLLRRRGVLPKVGLGFILVWFLYAFYASYIISKEQQGDVKRNARSGHGEKHEELDMARDELLNNRPRDLGLLQEGQQQRVVEREIEELDRKGGRAQDKPEKAAKPEAPQQVRQIESPGDANKPGEGGKPVVIDKDKLSAEERAQYELGWKNNAYNQFASDKISLHRNIDDNRDPECKKVKYRPNSQLPASSVIIIFHNEGWSVLLRTVHSVIDRSPPELLHEVILVDDKSTMDHLQKPLDDYVASLDKVKVIHAQRREGLIRARLIGAAAATGEMLVFLDSHCEATEGWLEPLADRVADDWSNVLVPVINNINDETLEFQYYRTKGISVGGFTWNLVFAWHDLPKNEQANRTSVVAPVRSPTMAGGLFAINRKYFEHIGTYDAGMEIWGGENLELSFRVWMCGGRLETIPCSHVGHIFRKRSPYSWKTDKTDNTNVVYRNTMRLAEVWLDDYKQYFYEHIGTSSRRNYGDISERIKLRQRLKCRSFDWFLRTIYPSLYVPRDAHARGEIRSRVGSQCLDAKSESRELLKPPYPWPCHGQGGNQFWLLTKTGEIRRDEMCLDFSMGGKSVITYTCHEQRGNQEWHYTQDDQLKHHTTGQCIEIANNEVIMSPCDASNLKQKWTWKRTLQNA